MKSFDAESPYNLPEGNVQICFSGGRTSAYMLWHLLEANCGLPERAKCIFTNTGREFEATYQFLLQCSLRWKVPIIWLEYAVNAGGKSAWVQVKFNNASRNGEPFEALIRKKKYLPNQVMRFCTSELKIKPAIGHLKHTLGWDTWHNAIGIRADEAHRARPSREPNITNWYPLVDAGVTKSDIADFWAKQPFDLELPIVNGRTPHSNCDGCFLKSEWTQAELARNPETRHRHMWWERMEAEIGGTFRPGYSKRDLRNLVERQGDWIFDMEGALCQADDGDCTG